MGLKFILGVIGGWGLNARLAGALKCIDQLACDSHRESHGFLAWHLLVVVTCCPVLGPLRVTVLQNPGNSGTDIKNGYM